jgi:hypothetical protein
MNETIEQTIKRLRFCQGCIDKFARGGMEAYELLERQISELESKTSKELNKAAE